jgi:transaldolase
MGNRILVAMSEAPPVASSRLAAVIRDGVREEQVHGRPVAAWKSLRATGTELWLDTGDMEAAGALWNPEFTALTTNNTLLNKEIQKGIYDAWVPQAAKAARADRPGLDGEELVLEIAFALNARHGLRLVERFGAYVSVELHTDLAHDAERSVAYGKRYAALCDKFIVKVPLTPEGLLAARRLEEDGIPVNFTLGFSARQNHLIASVARPSWVNVFLGRLNAYAADEKLCDGRWVGERATLASQATVARLRRELGLSTRQIAASLRSGEQVGTLAGTDVFTMPTAVAEGFLKNPPAELRDRTAEDYRPQWAAGVDPRAEGMNGLWEVEPAFVAACARLATAPWEDLSAESVLEGLGESGAAAVFPRLTPQEAARLEREGKAPKRATWREHVASGRAGLDGLFTQAGLLAFAQDQAALDARIREHVA